jgi:Protein of unknown function (DUF1580)
MIGSNHSPSELLSLSEARKLFPGRPRKKGRALFISPEQLYRWRRFGVNGVRLETVRIGGRQYIHRAAVAKFLEALAERPVPAAAETPNAGRQAAAAAARERLRAKIRLRKHK